jgi:hypothetical protein
MSLLRPHPTLVALLVYNRLPYLRLWLHAWKQCLKAEGEVTLVVVHNYDGIAPDIEFQRCCDEYEVNYIARRNAGYDIGAFQDVITRKICGEINYELLHWCIDDALPMRNDFLSEFQSKILQDEKIGGCGIQISHEYQKHLRTNCFMLRESVAKELQFPGSKIATKSDCYEFEHRRFNMLYQIERLGYQVLQIDTDINRFFWDVGHLGRYNLWEKHYKEFGNDSGR